MPKIIFTSHYMRDAPQAQKTFPKVQYESLPFSFVRVENGEKKGIVLQMISREYKMRHRGIMIKTMLKE